MVRMSSSNDPESRVTKLMKISTIEGLSPYQFMKEMTSESLRCDLAHQLLLQMPKSKGSFNDSVEEMERTEKYLRYVLKYATKD